MFPLPTTISLADGDGTQLSIRTVEDTSSLIFEGPFTPGIYRLRPVGETGKPLCISEVSGSIIIKPELQLLLDAAGL